MTPTVNLDLDTLYGNLKEAQFYLDTEVMNAMVPYMPRVTGTFIQETQARSRAIAGTGKVYAAAPPYGRYLYNGKVMVDSETGKGPRKIEVAPGEFILRFNKGAKLVPTERNLRYVYPNARPKWFEVAKANSIGAWTKLVGEVIDGTKKT